MSAAENYDLERLPLDSITDPGDNIRFDEGDLRGLTASIKQVGILSPIVVAPIEGTDKYRVIAGHRRYAVAIDLGLELVPVTIRTDLTEGADVLAMLDENEERDDLTDAEVAVAYNQLSLAGWSMTKIAKLTRSKPDQVKAGLAIAPDERLTKSVHTGVLSFEQAGRMAALDLTEDQRDRLLRAAEDYWAFKHEIEQLERNIAREKATEAVRATGVVMYDDVADDHPDARPLARMHTFNPMGNDEAERKAAIKATKAHAKCPGHAVEVVLAYDGTPNERAWCLDPVTHGHIVDKPRPEGAANAPALAANPMKNTDGTLTEEGKAERKMVVANNKAWDAAEPVRREFLTELFKRKTPPAKAMVFAVSLVAVRPDLFGNEDRVLTEVTGIQGEGGWPTKSSSQIMVAKAGEKNLSFALLKMALCAVEAKSNRDLWRQENPTFATYLAYLVSIGYTLSDVEQLVVTTSDEAAAKRAERIKEREAATTKQTGKT
jgi:ParB family chromosome partitioning protein